MLICTEASIKFLSGECGKSPLEWDTSVHKGMHIDFGAKFNFSFCQASVFSMILLTKQICKKCLVIIRNRKFKMQHIRNKLELFIDQLSRRKPTRFYVLVASLFIFTSVCVVFASISLRSSVTIGSRGSVKALYFGVYWDSECNNPVFNIDWGIIEPGSSVNVTVYVRNEGNVPMRIALNVTNWNPSNASDYMRLEWDYSGQVLQPNENIRTVLFLVISPDAIKVTDFSFDILITPFD